MRHSSARSDGRGDLTPTPAPDSGGCRPGWLLVGNSRWHWAEASDAGLAIRHVEAAAALADSPALIPHAWAAVGALPSAWPGDRSTRVGTADVPLEGLPAWLGVDRALAGWMAWRHRREAVLVADAGTVLSLTGIDRRGRFSGGRLIAGLSLQLRAMAEGTASLEAPSRMSGRLCPPDGPRWPAATEAAMAVGVSEALAAALAAALREWRQLEPDSALVLTGGDAPELLPLLRRQLAGQGHAVVFEADLALRGLVALRPAAGGGDQASPRSVSS